MTHAFPILQKIQDAKVSWTVGDNPTEYRHKGFPVDEDFTADVSEAIEDGFAKRNTFTGRVELTSVGRKVAQMQVNDYDLMMDVKAGLVKWRYSFGPEGDNYVFFYNEWVYKATTKSIFRLKELYRARLISTHGLVRVAALTTTGHAALKAHALRAYASPNEIRANDPMANTTLLSENEHKLLDVVADGRFRFNAVGPFYRGQEDLGEAVPEPLVRDGYIAEVRYFGGGGIYVLLSKGEKARAAAQRYSNSVYKAYASPNEIRANEGLVDWLSDEELYVLRLAQSSLLDWSWGPKFSSTINNHVQDIARKLYSDGFLHRVGYDPLKSSQSSTGKVELTPKGEKTVNARKHKLAVAPKADAGKKNGLVSVGNAYEGAKFTPQELYCARLIHMGQVNWAFGPKYTTTLNRDVHHTVKELVKKGHAKRKGLDWKTHNRSSTGRVSLTDLGVRTKQKHTGVNAKPLPLLNDFDKTSSIENGDEVHTWTPKKTVDFSTVGVNVAAAIASFAGVMNAAFNKAAVDLEVAEDMLSALLDGNTRLANWATTEIKRREKASRHANPRLIAVESVTYEITRGEVS